VLNAIGKLMRELSAEDYNNQAKIFLQNGRRAEATFNGCRVGVNPIHRAGPGVSKKLIGFAFFRIRTQARSFCLKRIYRNALFPDVQWQMVEPG
jgi:hypothetical protein